MEFCETDKPNKIPERTPSTITDFQHPSTLAHDELIPRNVRSIHRVHSSSIFERRGLGSPEEVDIFLFFKIN
jgi:hypothetical protein